MSLDVADWLQGLGLELYSPALRDNAIDAEVLPSLTAEDLKDLGVTLVGHRRRLLGAIAALKAAADSTTDPNASAEPTSTPASAASMAGLHTPLSTLHVRSHDHPAHESGPMWIATPSS